MSSSKNQVQFLINRLNFNIFAQKIQNMENHFNNSRNDRMKLIWLKFISSYLKVKQLHCILGYLNSCEKVQQYRIFHLSRFFSYYKYRTRIHQWKKLTSKYVANYNRVQFIQKSNQALLYRTQAVLNNIIQRPGIQEPFYAFLFKTNDISNKDKDIEQQEPDQNEQQESKGNQKKSIHPLRKHITKNGKKSPTKKIKKGKEIKTEEKAESPIKIPGEKTDDQQLPKEEFIRPKKKFDFKLIIIVSICAFAIGIVLFMFLYNKN